MVTGVETVTTGTGLTVTVTCAVLVHPNDDVAVTVYVVVVVGDAVTDAPVVLLNPVAGLQEYEAAFPVAVNVVDCPRQIEVFGDNVNVGSGRTVTVTCEVHPPGVPVTV